MADTSSGLVLRSKAGYIDVLTDDGRTVRVRVAKKVKAGPREATSAIVIGDRVCVRLTDHSGVVEGVEERRNTLLRQAPGRRDMRDVIAANLDAIIIVHSLREPDFNAARLDRLLAIAEQAEIPAIVVLNKADLAPPDETEEIAQRYRHAGYQVLVTSARTGLGVDALRRAAQGKMSAVLGPSGSGKSSLLNRLQPGLRLRTGEISEATGKGRHTTVASELLPLRDGGYIADTPGLRAVGLIDVAPTEVEWFFPEFRPFLGTCRFPDCLHQEEPGCAIRDAVDRGEISLERYGSYRRLLDDVREQEELATRGQWTT